MPRINKKYIKDPGELNYRIEIQRKTISDIVNGIVSEEWETIYSPRAYVSNATGKEYSKEGVEIYGKESKKFTFRTHPTLKIKQADIIIYDGERWEITSIFDYDDNRIYSVAVAVKCEQ